MILSVRMYGRLMANMVQAIEKIVYWLNRAKDFVENAQQLHVINLLIRYYETGDLHDFDIYSIECYVSKKVE